MRTFIGAIQGVYLGWNTAGRITHAVAAAAWVSYLIIPRPCQSTLPHPRPDRYRAIVRPGTVFHSLTDLQIWL
jgi:hypothetical protein